MPVVVLQPTSGHSTISSRGGPNSHIGLAVFVCLCANPPLGLVAVIFSACSKSASHTDYEAARVRGRISLFISVAGIVISVIIALVCVLIFYTKDS